MFAVVWNFACGSLVLYRTLHSELGETAIEKENNNSGLVLFWDF